MKNVRCWNRFIKWYQVYELNVICCIQTGVPAGFAQKHNSGDDWWWLDYCMPQSVLIFANWVSHFRNFLCVFSKLFCLLSRQCSSYQRRRSPLPRTSSDTLEFSFHACSWSRIYDYAKNEQMHGVVYGVFVNLHKIMRRTWRDEKTCHQNIFRHNTIFKLINSVVSFPT